MPNNEMADDSDANEGAGTDGTAQGRGAALDDRVAALEHAVATLSDEMRTRKVVVVDDAGMERIVGEVVNGNAELRIELAGTGPGDDASVVVFACVDPEDLGSAVGVQLWAAGNAVAELNAWPDGEGRWLAGVHIEDGND